MTRRRRELRPAASLLGRALRRSGVGPDPAVAPLRDAWAAAVGDAVSAAAQPIRLSQKGVATIACADAAWAAELRTRTDDLADLIAATLPSGVDPPTALRFVVAERPPVEDAPVGRAPIRPTPADLRRGDDLVSGIGDRRLRDLFARAAAATLARERSSRKTPGKDAQ